MTLLFSCAIYCVLCGAILVWDSFNEYKECPSKHGRVYVEFAGCDDPVITFEPNDWR